MRGHDVWQTSKIWIMNIPITPGSLLARHVEWPVRLRVEAGLAPPESEAFCELLLQRNGAAKLLLTADAFQTEVRGRWRLLASDARHYAFRIYAKQVTGPGTALGARLWGNLKASLCLRVTAQWTLAEVPCPAGSEVEPTDEAQPEAHAGESSPDAYARLLLGSWLEYHFSFKSDFIYFERFTFHADGSALRERWKQIDQIDDDEQHEYLAMRGGYRFVQPDEVRFEPEAPDGEPATLIIRPNIWPVGDIHLELQLSGGAPGYHKRLERERAENPPAEGGFSG